MYHNEKDINNNNGTPTLFAPNTEQVAVFSMGAKFSTTEWAKFNNCIEWHIAQLLQWIVIYGSIAFICKDFITLIAFGCVYPFTYDTLLNLRRGLKWNHLGKYDFLKFYQTIILLIIGITLLILQKG